jgi:DNA-binding transcriptional LysR family regulator
MNILHLKYAVEIADAGSISQASKNLLVAQPNISRSVKELEADLGITIFDRSTKGMVLTTDGEEFIGYARKILKQIEEVEALYKKGGSRRSRFSVSGPRASYISDAFCRMTLGLQDSPYEIYYNETNNLTAANNILHSDYELGILRYDREFSKHFTDMFEEKHFTGRLITEFRFVLIMSAESSLAKKKEIRLDDLNDFIEIAHADPYIPSYPSSKLRREIFSEKPSRQIYVYERGSQFDLLSRNPDTFIWVSPIPQELLDRYGLVQRDCVDYHKVYHDVLIHRDSYSFSDIDRIFIDELESSVERNISGAVGQAI